MSRLKIEPHQRIVLAWESIKMDCRHDDFIHKVLPHVGMIKIGLTSMHRNIDSFSEERNFVDRLITFQTAVSLATTMTTMGAKIFWDAKLNDTEGTVGKAVADIANMGPWGFTLHASMPDSSIEAAIANAGGCNTIGVTILTSFTPDECIRKFGAPPGVRVVEFAQDLARLGANGLVCSPLELSLIAENPECDKLIRMTPGVRPKGSALGQQKRVMTPSDAIRAGADYLIIGSPIMDAPDPVAAADRIATEIATAEANLSQI